MIQPPNLVLHRGGETRPKEFRLWLLAGSTVRPTSSGNLVVTLTLVMHSTSSAICLSRYSGRIDVGPTSRVKTLKRPASMMALCISIRAARRARLFSRIRSLRTSGPGFARYSTSSVVTTATPADARMLAHRIECMSHHCMAGTF
jgi:precorrin-4 methylase